MELTTKIFIYVGAFLFFVFLVERFVNYKKTKRTKENIRITVQQDEFEKYPERWGLSKGYFSKANVAKRKKQVQKAIREHEGTNYWETRRKLVRKAKIKDMIFFWRR